MSKSERNAYLSCKVLAIGASCLAVLFQPVRFSHALGSGFVHGAFMALTLLAFPVALVSVLAGIGLSFFLRVRSPSENTGPHFKPSVLVFAVCGALLFCAAYTFRLLPLFLGENRTPRLPIDNWLDKLL